MPTIALTFIDLPKGTTRSQALEMYRQTAESWRVNGDLIEKYYYFDEDRSIGGGVYIWPDRAMLRLRAVWMRD
jgi:hypothetical protein